MGLLQVKGRFFLAVCNYETEGGAGAQVMIGVARWRLGAVRAPRRLSGSCGAVAPAPGKPRLYRAAPPQRATTTRRAGAHGVVLA